MVSYLSISLNLFDLSLTKPACLLIEGGAKGKKKREKQGRKQKSSVAFLSISLSLQGIADLPLTDRRNLG